MTALAASNPFATCRVRPGAIAYRFPPGLDLAQLVDQLQANGWWGQIVGPHGTGKSTLLATLLPKLTRHGRQPMLLTLHDGARRLPAEHHRCHGSQASRLLVIDGYEQLSYWSRCRVLFDCWRHGWGLLVTTHKPVWLPKLFRTAVTPDLAVAVVDELTQGGAFRLEPAEVVRRLKARAGNFREALFDLYDAYERLR